MKKKANNASWLQELLTDAFWAQMNDIYTAMPGVVVEVFNDLKEQRIAVQPALNRLFQSGASEERTVILNVPVLFPSTSTSAITMPINKGDNVWLMFSMRAMEAFNEGNGKPVTPLNHLKFDQNDAVALIGLTPRRNAPNNPSKHTHTHSTKDFVIAHNLGKSTEVEIRLKPDGDMIINCPTKVTVNCSNAEVNATASASVTTPDLSVDANTTTWNGDINLTGNINQTGSQTVSGDVTASGISLATHSHDVTGIATGGSTVTSNPPN